MKIVPKPGKSLITRRSVVRIQAPLLRGNRLKRWFFCPWFEHRKNVRCHCPSPAMKRKLSEKVVIYCANKIRANTQLVISLTWIFRKGITPLICSGYLGYLIIQEPPSHSVKVCNISLHCCWILDNVQSTVFYTTCIYFAMG